MNREGQEMNHGPQRGRSSIGKIRAEHARILEDMRMNEPTPQQVEAACLSFRHDYGIMTEKERYYLQCEAVYWLRAWQSAGVDPLAEIDRRVGGLDRDVDAEIRGE